eukprot:TRINITY_DN13800_c1_g1_i1.p1 TRINITY_DN13800_c1_g1~~TRINITY_DN13800_c1_g1_i1.p1  ORF type:complete len:603 (+),score=287.15 TRINITY_DN13800_c1_g1_i1:91-1899(+)
MAEAPADAEKKEQAKEAHRRAAAERRFRIGKANTRDYQEQIQKEIRRLGVEKETLRKDNDRLKAEIAVKRAPGLSARTEKTPRLAAKNREIDRRKEDLTTLERHLDKEHKRLRDLDRKLDDHRERLSKARGDPKLKQSGRPYSARSPQDDSWQGGDWLAECKVISVNATQEAHQKIDRQVKVLENRLDRALVKFNEALHINKQLREQIDNLRRERGVFDAIYKKLERELQEKKKEMAFIIEVSNIAYEEKDNAINELDTLKMFAKKEMDSFAETFAELDELLEEDRKMKEAIKLRIAERKEKLAADQADEEARKKRSQKGAQQGSTPHAAASSAPTAPQAEGQMTLQMYEDAFSKIRQATRCDDISQLVSTFIHSEDDNFSLFNYVNELHRETERLEKERDQLLTEIEEAKGFGSNQTDLSRQTALRQLEAQLKDTELQNQNFVRALDDRNKILEEIMTMVDVVFVRMDCPPDKIVSVCGQLEKGAPAKVNSGNLLLYLAAIEVRTDEFLAAWHRQDRDGQGPPLFRGPALAYGENPLNVEVPATGDDFADDDDEDEGTKVMSREELVEKSQKRIKQQQLHDRKAGKQGWGGKSKPAGRHPR